MVKKDQGCFIPTASGDSSLYKLNFYRAFSKLDCITSHIDFFSRTENLEEIVLSQDIIYVGGGNTKSMLAVWKEWNLHIILENAYKKGIVMSGVSAGAICWFEKGITDSFAKVLTIIDCLRLVDGIISKIKDERKVSNVIATGGLSNVFSRDTSMFDKIDLRLTIKGLVYISSFNED